MLNISQAAQAAGLSPKAVRDYEAAGLIQPARSSNGYRQYSAADVDALRFVRHAREVDFSLIQIAQLLALRNNPQRASADVKTLVGQHITRLAEKIERLNAMKATLQSWHDLCGGNHDPDCPILDRLDDCGCGTSSSQNAQNSLK